MNTDEQRSQTILLVEDEALIALNQKRKIEDHGYSVLTVTTGEKAVALFDAGEPIDLVLMDIDLGAGMPGTEAATAILERRTVPIVFLTSHTERSVVDAVKGITRYGYVLKSSGEFVLLEAIQMAFELFEANQALEMQRAAYAEQSEELHNFFSLSLDLLAIADIDGRFLKVNQAWGELLGYEVSELEGRSYLELVHPEDVDLTIEAMEQLKGQGQVRGFVNRYRTKYGEYRWIEWRSAPQGERVYAAARDVTERVLREERLTRESRLFKQLFEEHPTPRLLVDPGAEGRIVEANAAALCFYGYEKEELVGMPVTTINNGHPHWVMRNMQEAVNRRQRRFSFEHQLADGSLRQVQVDSSPVTIDGTVLLYSVIQDVTEKHNAATEAAEQHRILQGVIEHASHGIVITDEAGLLVEWNRAQERITGVPRERVLGAPVWEAQLLLAKGWVPSGVEKDELQGRFSRFLAGEGDPSSSERKVSIDTPEGKKEIFQSVFLVETSRGRRLVSLSQDMTKLIESERQYRLLAENSHDVIALVDGAFNTIYVSPSVQDLSGYSVEWFDSRSLLDALHPDDYAKAQLILEDDLMRMNPTGGARLRVVRPDHTIVWIEAKVRYEYDEMGALSTALLNLRDISEQVHAENALEKRSRHVEFLMHEVQHRVKNIMATMVGLLNLQAASVTDASARAALEDSANRFRSMSHLYDRLYRSQEPGEHDLGEFLKPLVEEIVAAFPEGDRVSTSVEADRITMSTEALSNIGILVTEIVTNSMKYAFPEGRGGTIELSLRYVDGRVRLLLADDGVGLPPEAWRKGAGGFGTELIGELTEQLDGELAVDATQGTRYTITIPRGTGTPEHAEAVTRE